MNLPITKLQENKMFSVAGKFPVIQTPEVWIPGTVKVFRQRQDAVTPKFRF